MIAMTNGRFKDLEENTVKFASSLVAREKKNKCAMYTCYSYFIENMKMYTTNPIYWT